MKVPLRSILRPGVLLQKQARRQYIIFRLLRNEELSCHRGLPGFRPLEQQEAVVLVLVLVLAYFGDSSVTDSSYQCVTAAVLVSYVTPWHARFRRWHGSFVAGYDGSLKTLLHMPRSTPYCICQHCDR
eukprot:g9043.t1